MHSLDLLKGFMLGKEALAIVQSTQAGLLDMNYKIMQLAQAKSTQEKKIKKKKSKSYPKC